MSEAAPAQHEAWTSHTAFLLAAVGAAVGLGNIWRFPYVAGQNGGGAFVLVYVGFVILLGIPLITAELAIGRRGQQSAVITMRNLVRQEGCSGFWRSIGWLSVLVPIMGLTFYSIVAGWSLDYIYRAAAGSFEGFGAAESNATFDSLKASPGRMIFWHSVYIGLTIFVVGRGLHKGLERTFKLMMPTLFVILLVMVSYAAVAADFSAGLGFLFNPDFSKLTLPAVLMALGQAFFSLAVGTGALITYGAYLPKTISLPFASSVIGVVDTLAAILAGLAIFPIVFAYGLDPAGGEGLIFVTLPIAFGQMPGGHLLGTLFFVLLSFAAFTSSIAMLEPVVSWLEELPGFRRPWMAFYSGTVAWAGGLAIALSFNQWKDVRPLGMFEFFADKGLFGLMDFVTANLMLPLNALLIALFAGWMMARSSTMEELALAGFRYDYWRFVMRFVAPAAILAIVVYNLLS